MRLRLRTRHTLVLLSVVVVIVVTLTAALLTRFISTSNQVAATTERAMGEQLRHQVQHRAVQVTQMLSENVVNPLYANDMDAMRQLLQTVKRRPGVRYVYVLNPELRVVHDGNTLIPKYGKQLSDPFSKIQTPLATTLLQSGPELMDVTMPVARDGIVLGYVRVGVSLSSIRRDVENVRKSLEVIANRGLEETLETIFLVSAAFVVLGIAVAVLISRRLTQPINAVLAGVERIRLGDLETPVASSGEDELAQLAQQVDQMRLALKDSSEVLAERNRELELQITERRELSIRLAQAEKMDAIGRLAGGVAHDFNNHLTIIKGNAELLSMTSIDDEDREAVETILASTVSAAGLTRQLLAFARQQPMQHSVIDIHKLVHEVVHLLSRSIDKRINLEVSLNQDACLVRGDATQLQNLLLNLGLNACDAIDTVGTITMRVGFAEQHSAPAELGANRFIYIGVHDTGSGIANKDVGRIFEPFFTTKDFRKGTGLGLAAAYGAAKAHGGAITVRSLPGDTEFLLYLPLAEGAMPVQNELASGSPLVASGITKALIIDDEAGVRRVLARLLQTLGYAVETCESGDLGVEVFRARPEEFQLVVLDMMMPGMSGAEVLTVLREMDPLVPIIVATGHSFADFPPQDANTRTLTKPITRNELRQCLQTIGQS